MSKLGLLCLLLLVLENQSLSVSAKRATTKRDLENYSIVLLPPANLSRQHEEEVRTKFLELRNQAYPVIACRAQTASYQKTDVYPLTRPNEPNVVAILVVDSNGKTQLNPVGYGDYGPIPELPSLTVLDCEQLWGKSIRKSERDEKAVKTFNLIFNGNRSKKDFHIDTVFEKGLLKKYRVGSAQSSSNLDGKWQMVN